MTVTRRIFHRQLLATLALPPFFRAEALTVKGVRLGLQTYSFHTFEVGGDAAVDHMCRALTRLKVNLIELFSPQIAPFPTPPWSWQPWSHAPAVAAPDVASKDEREKLRAWRITAPDAYFAAIRAKFARNGVSIYCYNYSFEADMTDDEIAAGFRQARLLGARYITSSSMLSMAQRVVPFSEKYKFSIGWHNHADLTDADAICTPQSLARLMAMSRYYKINLDIGHFTTAGFDPVPFITDEHANITNLHMKDRMKHDGENRPFGEGQTDVAGVLLLLRNQHIDIPAMVEYEYLGKGSPEQEIAKALQYESKILES